MMKRYDVAIVGAGPAGSVLAAELAKNAPEMRVLLINGASQKGEKVCGGLLSPDAQKILAELGLTLPKNVLADPQIFDVHTLDLVCGASRHYQRHYLNMNRAAFDAYLLSRVPAGVDTVEGLCTSVSKENGSFILSVKSGDTSVRYTSSSVVGADGAGSVVRRTFFGTGIYHYVAIQQWFDGCDTLPPYSCIFDEKTSNSCSWTIKKNGHAVFGGAFKIHGCRAAFEAQKQRLMRSLSPELDIDLGDPQKTEACLLSCPKNFGDLITGSKDGVYLIGEAAGFISASSFEGISYAIKSAKLLADAYTKERSGKNILRVYRASTLNMRLKLCTKMIKRKILCTPVLRRLIMKSGIASIKKY